MNRYRIALVSVVVPVMFAAVGVGLQLAWLPELPATIATHWNFAGEPDAYGPSWTMPLLLGVVGLALPALFGGILARTVAPAGPTATQKLLAVASLFAVTLVSVAVTASVAIQRDGAGEPRIPLTLMAGLLVGLVLAAAAWFLLPRAVPGRSIAGDSVTPVAVGPGERVVWVGHAAFATWTMTALVATVVLVSSVVAFAVAMTGIWPLALVPVVLVASVLATASWTVRVDPTGLTIRSALGWPRYKVAMADIEEAGVSSLVPLGEFGGYGVRWGLGRRLGIVTRGGEALEVRRRDGRTVVATVDDAATAAGLLAAYAAKG